MVVNVMAGEDQQNADWPSLDVVFDAVKGRVAEQHGLIATLDSKAGFSLAAASILTGGIGTLTAGLATFTGNQAKPMKHANLGLFEISAS